MKNYSRPVWAEINLDNLAHNMREIRRLTKKDAMVTAVIKADGYGHGAVEIGKTLLENGADRFAVATLSEAIQLRREYKDIPILILGYTPVVSAEKVIENHITQAIYNYEQASEFSKVAVKMKEEVVFHVKLDTGMNRIGFRASDKAVEEIVKISKLPNIKIEGIFTHFAVADEVDKTYTMEQVKKYNYVCDKLEKMGIDIEVRHVSNSAAIIDIPELNYNMVRAGIILYGLYPSDDVIKERINLKEVMSLKAELSHVKNLEKGMGISYGLTYTTEKDSVIGTIPIGYADGFTRLYSGKAMGIVCGEKRPVVGRICMDQCMLDLTGLSAKVGDEVILFGTDGKNTISIDDVAAYVGTINYEVVCMIDKRVPRVYTKGEKVVKARDYVLEL